jgi:SAM-dependent methyltransferase
MWSAMTDPEPSATFAYTDRDSLRTRAYADPGKLGARAAIYRYQQPRHDLTAYVVRLLRDAGPIVIDLGCGAGQFTRALRADRADRQVVALDLSAGMVASSEAPGAVADAVAIPLRSRSADAVIAMHMLYHVPRPEQALAEIARVLRPHGTAILSTNAFGDKRELRRLHARAAAEAGQAVPDEGLAMRFNLDMATSLAMRYFTTVERIDLEAAVEVPDAGPVVAFIESTRDWYAGHDQVMARVRTLVDDVIATEGAFRFRTHMGFLVCR